PGPRSPARPPREPTGRLGQLEGPGGDRPTVIGPSDGVLGEVALHRGLARQVYATLAVDLGHDDHHLVADGHHVLDGRHVVVGELADADQAFLATQDL